VLDLAKIEAGKQELKLDTVELARFQDYARRVFEPLAEEKKLSLKARARAGPATRDQHRTAAGGANVTNCWQRDQVHGPGRSRTAHRSPKPGTRFTRPELSAESTVAFSVSDTGIGIARAAQERVFAPFEQIESHSSRRYAGTGLGLAISRESAAILGGELQLESEPGKGSTFTLLCRSTPPADAARKLSERASAQVSDDRDGLADDGRTPAGDRRRPVLAEQLVDIIRAPGSKRSWPTRAKTAFAWRASTGHKASCWNVNLPDIDGWQVMERCVITRAPEKYPSFRVRGRFTGSRPGARRDPAT